MSQIFAVEYKIEKTFFNLGGGPDFHARSMQVYMYTAVPLGAGL